jgi:hypothetical protein
MRFCRRTVCRRAQSALTTLSPAMLDFAILSNKREDEQINRLADLM